MAHRGLIVAIVVLCTASLAFGDLTFTILGDWGTKLTYTNVIAARSTTEKSQFTVALGDNFYKNGQPTHGVTSVDDPKWQTVFEQQFPQPFFQKRWYVIAGNHDYDGNEKAQLAYTKKSNRWYFPSLYYHFAKRVQKGVSMEFFMLDSQVLANDNDELSSYDRKVDMKQLVWLGKVLKRSKADWKIVFSHHQIYYNKGKNDFLSQKLVPLLENNNVAAFFNGHMHSFQHLRSPKVHYFTVGSTGIQAGVDKSKKGEKELRPEGVRVAKLYPTKEQFKSCGLHDCKAFAIINVKDARKMTLKLFNSKNTPVYKATIANPKTAGANKQQVGNNAKKVAGNKNAKKATGNNKAGNAKNIAANAKNARNKAGNKKGKNGSHQAI
jgi:hypothetical protein